MRRCLGSLVFIAVAIFATKGPTWADPSRAVTIMDRILRAASTQIGGLSIIRVSEDAGSRLRWAAWSERESRQAQIVHLALIALRDGRSVPVWSVARPDSYEPTIQRAWSWQYNGNPVLLFTYQEGAAAETLEVYGLDERGRPILLEVVSLVVV
jgi:hypothetical protein